VGRGVAAKLTGVDFEGVEMMLFAYAGWSIVGCCQKGRLRIF